MTEKELELYRKKRNFEKTTEPDGANLTSIAAVTIKDSHHHEWHSFVIQEHHASTLHYDFRLEVNGILKSWAVPKGFSTNPEDKRLAIPTEDHPLAYKDFAGTIPEGEYGAGKVIIWDTGKYQNLREVSMQTAWQQGKIEIELSGKKIKGKYVLIRMQYDRLIRSTSTKSANKQKPWLLLKVN